MGLEWLKKANTGRSTLEWFKKGDAGRSTESLTPFTYHFHGHDSYAENEPDCRSSSPEEVALREHVEAVNKKHGVEFKMA